jgi:RNA polymerase sigma factor (sigma-70 family)
MANSHTLARRSHRRPFVAAMVLGTALSALSPSGILAADAPESTMRAVGDMSRYCTTCWRNARLPVDLWTDCTQEVLCRLLERVPADAWGRVLQAEGEEHREFLRAIDAVKKRTQRSRKWAAVPVEQMADRRDPEAGRIADEREQVQQAARELLSSRQQRILQLSFEGWSVHEIANELNAPAERISDEKYKAIRKLRSHLTDDKRGAIL